MMSVAIFLTPGIKEMLEHFSDYSREGIGNNLPNFRSELKIQYEQRIQFEFEL